MTMIIMKAMAMMIMMIISMIISLPTAREWGIAFGGELIGSEGKVCKRGNNTYNYRIIILNKGPQYLHDI